MYSFIVSVEMTYGEDWVLRAQGRRRSRLRLRKTQAFGWLVIPKIGVIILAFTATLDFGLASPFPPSYKYREYNTEDDLKVVIDSRGQITWVCIRSCMLRIKFMSIFN